MYICILYYIYKANVSFGCSDSANPTGFTPCLVGTEVVPAMTRFTVSFPAKLCTDFLAN